jgi:molecular chaperone DnaK
MPAYIGIDLGTTFSALAVLDDVGRPVIVHNADGKNLTPSAVTEEDGSLLVGEVARKAAAVDSASAAVRFKRDMGTDASFAVNDHKFTPTELSVFVLKKLVKDAMATVGDIAEAVVTIPANFSNEAREATMAAAHAAGLRTKYIINEPTAAALYYAYRQESPLHGTYAVYDLGGGTFDVSIIEVNGREVSVKASNGVNKLGGDDFDEALRLLIARKYEAQVGSPLSQEAFSRHDAEVVKIDLSQRKKGLFAVAGQRVEVTRQEFEEAISARVAQAEMLCEATLEDAGITRGALAGVILAGGSTRIPAVRDSIVRVFGKEPMSTANVDEVVALGAALYAAYKSDGASLSAHQKAAVSTLKVRETTSKCFGTIILGFDEVRQTRRLQNSIIIPKGTEIPCSRTESFFTIRDGQESVECTVTESVSAETDPEYVNQVWQGELALPPGRPVNQEVQVTYSYDENQIMHLEFRDVATGKRLVGDLSLAAHDGVDSSTIDQFLVE